jgi:hypothetical protein
MFIRLYEKDTRDDSGILIRGWGSRLNGERKLATLIAGVLIIVKAMG